VNKKRGSEESSIRRIALSDYLNGVYVHVTTVSIVVNTSNSNVSESMCGVTEVVQIRTASNCYTSSSYFIPVIIVVIGNEHMDMARVTIV
jgi:hypothetical protein